MMPHLDVTRVVARRDVPHVIIAKENLDRVAGVTRWFVIATPRMLKQLPFGVVFTMQRKLLARSAS